MIVSKQMCMPPIHCKILTRYMYCILVKNISFDNEWPFARSLLAPWFALFSQNDSITASFNIWSIVRRFVRSKISIHIYKGTIPLKNGRGCWERCHDVIMFMLCFWCREWILCHVCTHSLLSTMSCTWLLISSLVIFLPDLCGMRCRYGWTDETVHNETKHLRDVIMSSMASQIPGVSVVCSTICSGVDKKTSKSLAFVREIHQWQVDSRHKGPITRKMFPFDDVIMKCYFGDIFYDYCPANFHSEDLQCSQ